jgi:hypothetical protein
MILLADSRSIRSREDWATTYILDFNFIFVKKICVPYPSGFYRLCV